MRADVLPPPSDLSVGPVAWIRSGGTGRSGSAARAADGGTGEARFVGASGVAFVFALDVKRLVCYDTDNKRKERRKVIRIRI